MSQPMSNADFRDHIKAIVGPLPKADKPCVRKPTDRGYYPPARPPQDSQFETYWRQSAGASVSPPKEAA